MKSILTGIVLVSLLLVGCQSTGPIPTGPDTYMISKTSAGGAFANMDALRREVIMEANSFAASRGKVAVRIDSADSRPTHGMPSYEYNFRLADPSDRRSERSTTDR